jgi:hypothetical protein
MDRLEQRMEQRMDRLEQRLDQRMDRLDQRMDRLEQIMDCLEQRMDHRDDLLAHVHLPSAGRQAPRVPNTSPLTPTLLIDTTSHPVREQVLLLNPTMYGL